MRKPDIILALKELISIITNSMNERPLNPFMKSFFNSLSTTICEQLAPLFEEEDEDIQEQCCSILTSLSAHKWINSNEELLPYIFESLSHCMIPSQFTFLGTIEFMYILRITMTFKN